MNKRFPPHLNKVSTLPCETWNAHRGRAATELLQKETPYLWNTTATFQWHL